MIRNAETGDLVRIGEIWNRVIRETAATFNSREKTHAEIAALVAARRESGHGTWVALDRGAVCGFVTYAQFRAGVGYARTTEHTVIMDESAGGKGLARALMGAMEDHARSCGVHSNFAGVSGENPAGIAFHERLGYRTVAVLPQVGFKFGRWMDLHLMQKIL